MGHSRRTWHVRAKSGQGHFQPGLRALPVIRRPCVWPDDRYCEERSDEAIDTSSWLMDCFASLAMTAIGLRPQNLLFLFEIGQQRCAGPSWNTAPRSSAKTRSASASTSIEIVF